MQEGEGGGERENISELPEKRVACSLFSMHERARREKAGQCNEGGRL